MGDLNCNLDCVLSIEVFVLPVVENLLHSGLVCRVVNCIKRGQCSGNRSLQIFTAIIFSEPVNIFAILCKMLLILFYLAHGQMMARQVKKKTKTPSKC